MGEAGVAENRKDSAPDRADELRRQAPVGTGVGDARVGGRRGGEEPKEGGHQHEGGSTVVSRVFVAPREYEGDEYS